MAPLGFWQTHIDDILCCGERDVLNVVQKYLERRIGDSEVPWERFVHMGMELSAHFPPKKFTDALDAISTKTDLLASRQRPLSMEDIWARQCDLGVLRRLATVSRADICATLAHLAAKVKTLRGGDVFRINDLIKTVKARQRATVLAYESRVHCGDLTLAHGSMP